MSTGLRTASNTNLVSFLRTGEKRTMLSLIPEYAGHGLKALDLNFCEMMNPSSELRDHGDGYIESLLRLKEDLGLGYIQAHAPYPRDYKALSLSDKILSDNEILKSMKYAETLGIPHIVIHPIKGSVKENITYFSSLLDRYDGSIMIAIENMEGEDEIGSAEELLEIAGSLGERAGICLDTGHANIRGEDIPAFIRSCGKHLIGTHIADNDGKSDQHLLPGFGSIRWEEVIPAFRSTYDGFLTLECMFFSRRLPQSLSGNIISLALAVNEWLLSL